MNQKILAILNGLHPEFNFAESANFIEDGMLDSFDVVSLVAELEENFNIAIDGEDILPENFASIESIKELVSKSEANQ
jgi:acyl carrier protein